MVRTLIKKVRKLIQGDKAKKTAKAPKAAPLEEKAAAPAPLPVVPAEAPAPAAEHHPARRSRPAPAASHAPEPLRQAKERRAAVKEEWRPGQKKEGGAPRETRAPREPRAEGETPRAPRPPREPRAPRAEGDAPRSHRPRREGPAKPSDMSDMSDKSQSDRPRRPRRPREEAGRAAPSPQRGKGFSFPRPKPPHGDWDRGAHEVPVAEGKTRFADLGLPDELLHAVTDLGYQYCTPIQAGILPALLDGRDGIGQAQTGTGKTAAFLMASFARMMRHPLADPKPGTPRMLIIAPTRELVLQIEEEAATLAKYTPIQSLPVYGGLDYEPQKDALRHNVIDLVVATPGRLIDFLRSRVVDLSQVETLVLDEADRMLDMGFIPDVKRIVQSTPHKDKRQTLFFSATFTDEVRRLAQSWTNNPMEVNIAPTSVAADTVDQTVYIVTDEDKFPLVVNLLRNLQPSRTLIFCNRRDNAQYLCDRLKDYDFKVELLTGAVPQAKRVRTLEQFRDGSVPIVVATDVAGRGIHVEDVGLVINFHLPEDAEDYVHRIGRTGRAGAEGRSVCFASEFDSFMIPDIEKFIGRPLVCTHPEEEWLKVEARDRHHHNRRREESRDAGGSGGGRSRSGGGGRGGPGGGRGGPRRR